MLREKLAVQLQTDQIEPTVAAPTLQLADGFLEGLEHPVLKPLLSG